MQKEDLFARRMVRVHRPLADKTRLAVERWITWAQGYLAQPQPMGPFTAAPVAPPPHPPWHRCAWRVGLQV